MITIAWYNLVAILALILWIIWLNKISDEDSFGIGTLVVALIGAAFFAIWGGIFWW